MKRTIIEIDANKCNGCGLCVNACHEGAIAMVDGKAKIVNEAYCDGLGACLPACPTDAIRLIEKDAPAFDEAAALQAKQARVAATPMACGCPGTMAKSIAPKASVAAPAVAKDAPVARPSRLGQWPVQIQLINPHASYLAGAHLLIAADCTAYAYANIHDDYIAGRVCLIGCPKLDDNEGNFNKIYAILMANDIKSITVLRMEVPCCGGIIEVTKRAILSAGKILPYREIIVTTDGEALENN